LMHPISLLLIWVLLPARFFAPQVDSTRAADNNRPG